jgi:hypothetical protein
MGLAASASPKCTGGRWYSPSQKTCFNGFYDEVTFTAGGDTNPGMLWEQPHGGAFASTTDWAPYVPAVQFKAGK